MLRLDSHHFPYTILLIGHLLHRCHLLRHNTSGGFPLPGAVIQVLIVSLLQQEHKNVNGIIFALTDLGPLDCCCNPVDTPPGQV